MTGGTAAQVGLGVLHGADDVQLCGDVASLSALGALLQGADPAEAPYEIPLVQLDSGGYGSALRALVVTLEGGPVRISRDDQTIWIAGDADRLATLGANLAWFVANEDPQDALAHLHLEYLSPPAHPSFTADSIPLVIAFR